jgi:outer membrane protein OmpA-like peptidoglycan-associated protein
MYQTGEGVPKDLARAAALHQRSCDEGLAVSCGLLGGAYTLGEGVPQDFERSARLLERSCDGGVGPSCSGLGLLYLAGKGVERNAERGLALFKRGCDGYAPACMALGDVYAQGFGIPKNPVRAADFYRRACTAGETNACNKLSAVLSAPPATAKPEQVSEGDDGRQPSGRIDVPGSIEFDDAKATLKRGAENERTLSSLKALLDASPQITRLRIEGHMDNTLTPATAESLTGRRALEVKKALVRLGVAPERLLAVSFGQNMPLADNATAQGRAKNRRIEFHVAALDGRSVRPDEAAGGKVFR